MLKKRSKLKIWWKELLELSKLFYTWDNNYKNSMFSVNKILRNGQCAKNQWETWTLLWIKPSKCITNWLKLHNRMFVYRAITEFWISKLKPVQVKYQIYSNNKIIIENQTTVLLKTFLQNYQQVKVITNFTSKDQL